MFYSTNGSWSAFYCLRKENKSIFPTLKPESVK